MKKEFCKECNKEFETCEHIISANLLDCKMSSEDINSFDSNLKYIIKFHELKVPSSLIALNALWLAEKYYSKKGIIEQWREEYKRNSGNWDQEDIDAMNEAEESEILEMMENYKIPEDLKKETDKENIARHLYICAQSDDPELFDKELDIIMSIRRKCYIENINEEGLVEIWRWKTQEEIDEEEIVYKNEN